MAKINEYPESVRLMAEEIAQEADPRITCQLWDHEDMIRFLAIDSKAKQHRYDAQVVDLDRQTVETIARRLAEGLSPAF
jgi:hypothetical protein